MDDLTFRDLLKSHKLFMKVEGRWRFYEAYIKNVDLTAWITNPEVPFKDGLLLFGFVHSWDPNYTGDLTKFYEIYPKVFPKIKKLANESIVKIELNSFKDDIKEIFDNLCYITWKKKYYQKPEYTDTSKLIHGILPQVFVMWDRHIRKNLVAERNDGECYSSIFLPNMQKMARDILDTYIDEKGGDYLSASKEISSFSNGYSIAKLLDEYNYLRYTKKKQLSDIRNMKLS